MNYEFDIILRLATTTSPIRLPGDLNLFGGIEKLVALALREFAAQSLGKLVSEVSAEDICWYSQTLRIPNTYQGTRDTVKCILNILTGHNAKTQDVGDLVYKWIIRVTPLTSILFGGRVIERPFTALLPIYTYPYNLKRDHWKSRSNNSCFTPHVETLQEMDQVFVDNNFPLTPFTHVELLPQRRRAPLDDFQSYSPPRRARPCYRQCDGLIDQTETACSRNATDNEPSTSQPHQREYEVTHCPRPADMKNERKCFREGFS